MKLTDEQRIAVCRILLDVVGEEGSNVSVDNSCHYLVLCEKIQLKQEDYFAASRTTVLSSLAIVRDIHYQLKMLIGLVVHDLYSQNERITVRQRIAFSILMNAIDWPISFSEISSLS